MPCQQLHASCNSKYYETSGTYHATVQSNVALISGQAGMHKEPPRDNPAAMQHVAAASHAAVQKRACCPQRPSKVAMDAT
jgi:hypothetical protein